MNEDAKKKRADYMREYQRKLKGYTSETVPNPGRRKNTADELWKKVDIRGEDECWPWLGYKNNNGYGRTWINDKGYYAHRVIFNLKYPGIITLSAPKKVRGEKGFLMHSCDNPECCNPSHLRVGTHHENMLDKVAKGRQADFKYGKAPRCKLTMDQAKKARKMRIEGASVKSLSELFGISLASMKSLLLNKSYKE